MESIWQGLVQAFFILIRLDPEALAITVLSLEISAIATIISLVVGIPFGTLLALKRFPGTACCAAW